ncbi:MAG: lysophospholipid acyltransferase family protein [Bacteroidota bacterium]
MQAVLYYISLPFIYLLSLLPFWVLYRISDFLFVVVYYVLGYRRRVVMTNLKNSFPQKSKKELRVIQRRFYRYFCDLILETLKSLTISPRVLRQHLSMESTEVLKKYAEEKRSITIVMGHWGNWELGGARFALEPLHKLFVIYHPLHNKYFDQLVYRMRTRLGNGLYAMKDTIRGVIRDREILTATAFIADQTPFPKNAHWMTFLHQDTPFFTGAGKIARKMNYPVIYVGVKRVRRGHYAIFAEELISEPAESKATDIVEAFAKRLEVDIHEIPEIWLWTHRRWKHKRPG